MTDPRSHQQSHDEYVPDADEFEQCRREWRESLGNDSGLRRQALDLQLAAEQHRLTYTWSWAGVPIIRLADDIVVLQEIFWAYRPEKVIEAGVARGGSLVLNASLMSMTGMTPAVLGIDHKIFPHTRESLDGHPLAGGIQLLQADSTSDEAVSAMQRFMGTSERTVVILDSNHTHSHVLGELRALAPLLPVGGLVLVADTLIEELPRGHYAERPWDVGDNPATAVRQFLDETPEFALAEDWSRRGLVTEFRDGVIRRVS